MSKIYIFDYTAEGDDGTTVHGQMEMLSALTVDAIQAIHQQMGHNIVITNCQLRKDDDEDDADVVEHIKAILQEDNPHEVHGSLETPQDKPKNFLQKCRDYLAKPTIEPTDMETIEDTLPAPIDMGELDEVNHG